MKLQPALHTVLFAASLFGGVLSARAALVIDAEDIVNDQYTYTLLSNSSYVATFNADVFSKTGTTPSRETSTGFPAYVRPTGAVATASFVYVFDFSALDYTVETVSFTDTLRAFQNTVTMSTQYSIDGGTTWNTVRSISTNTTSSGTVSISLSTLPEYTGDVDTVLYRANYATKNGLNFSTPGTQQHVDFQWGRASDGATSFSAVFGLAAPIPEPSTSAFLAGSALLGFAALRRRRR